MKKTIAAAILAALTMPVLAAQPQAPGAAPKAATPAPRGPHTIRGQLTLFEQANYSGARNMIDVPRRNVHTDWNIRSISVHPGDRWQICVRSSYRDPCIILDRSVPDASVIGVEGQIGSARPAPAEKAD